jgi:hypothetical protein
MRIESQLQIVYWPVSKLVRYIRNPRKNDTVVDRICGSIREYGFVVPILAKADGTAIDGDLRLKGAIKEGMNEVPVIVYDGWTEAQVKAFRIMVNRSVTWAEWDDELLSLELQELAAADFNLELTGFDSRELEDLLTLPDNDEQADVAPPLPENPVSRLGDLWLAGNRRNQHRILCADATSPEAVSRLLGDRKPFLMICDPPYGITLAIAGRQRPRGVRNPRQPETTPNGGKIELQWIGIDKTRCMRRQAPPRLPPSVGWPVVMHSKPPPKPSTFWTPSFRGYAARKGNSPGIGSGCPRPLPQRINASDARGDPTRTSAWIPATTARRVAGGVRLPVGRLRAFGQESTRGAPACSPPHPGYLRSTWEETSNASAISKAEWGRWQPSPKYRRITFSCRGCSIRRISEMRFRSI